MNRRDLILNIGTEAGITRRQADRFLASFIKTVGDTLARGESIRVSGLGTFYVRRLPARLGRNPTTGEPIRIPVRRRPAFKPGRRVKKVLGDSEIGNLLD
jgi:DNA-binding protein HU-beta